ncbi:MAG: GTP pyrophosphokinase family protein [Clostridia bacterium]|nr:GTP pyrophosphokinase family protein [Clostridia bacterium]
MNNLLLADKTIPADLSPLFHNYQELLEMQQLYNAAIKEIKTKLDILNDEFKVRYMRNPIHHIDSRLKSPQSILKKLNRRHFEVSLESAKKNLNDIAGIRVVCDYIDDVYSVADMLLRQSDLRLVETTDYIKTPNYNGYRSLHLDFEVPIYLSERTEYVTAEVQIRTVAMDFWASLEHDLHYKSEKDIPADIVQQMLKSADEIAAIDQKMQDIYRRIQQIP